MPASFRPLTSLLASSVSTMSHSFKIRPLGRVVILSAATAENRFALRPLDVADEAVFVLREVGGRALGLTVLQGFFHLSDDKSEPVATERRLGFTFEAIHVTNGHGARDAAMARDGRQIRSGGRRGRAADPAAAVLLVVEDEDDEVGGLQRSERRQVEKRQ